MAHYIDKDVLVAMIKRHIKEEPHSYFCKCLLSEIDTLEVKEVDVSNICEKLEESKPITENVKLPKKYETCDWMFIYNHIGLTDEHVKRLNNAINILKSINEHTDAKYLKEIKDKLLLSTPLK